MLGMLGWQLCVAGAAAADVWGKRHHPSVHLCGSVTCHPLVPDGHSLLALACSALLAALPAVWMHCLSGRRSLALVPPTPRNLATFAAWASSARYAGVFLPAHCEGVIRLELGPGTSSSCQPACVLCAAGAARQ